MAQSITLQQNHKEGDVQYYKGQTVMLPDDTANWLRSIGLQQRAERIVLQDKPKVKDVAEKDAVKNRD